MRKMTFPVYERAKLIPVDLLYGKYKLLIALLLFFVLSGLDRTGFIFTKMWETCRFPMANIIGAYFAGIVIAPLLLPWVPFRAFALKGAFWGAVITILLNLFYEVGVLESVAFGLINLSLASFMTMNFHRFFNLYIFVRCEEGDEIGYPLPDCF